MCQEQLTISIFVSLPKGVPTILEQVQGGRTLPLEIGLER